MPRHTTALTAAFLMLTSISGCALGTGGGQQSAPGASDAPAVAPALKVDAPKNLKGIADACQLLTPEQRAALQVDGEPEPEESQYKEPACNFAGDALTATISINSNFGGMTGTHERKDNFDNFAPTEVAGYPAAQVNFSDTLCTVMTGVSDEQSVDVYYAKNSGGTPEMDDPCGYAKKIAAEVIKNVPAA